MLLTSLYCNDVIRGPIFSFALSPLMAVGRPVINIHIKI